MTGSGREVAFDFACAWHEPMNEARVVAAVTWDEIGRPERAQNSTQDLGRRFVWLPPGKLHPHLKLQRYGIRPTTAEHNKILQDDTTFLEAIDVTKDGTILDGYPQWKAALDANCNLVLCIEHSLTAEQEIEWLLHRHKRRVGWIVFCRIMVALELEPKLRREALANQIAGGQNKVLSNLTKVQEKHVRSQLAKLADTCEAYIDYAKQLRNQADDSILRALERGEVTIHWAWNLLKRPKCAQRDILENRRVSKAVHQAYPPRKQRAVPIDLSRILRIWPVLARHAHEIKGSLVLIEDEKVEVRVQMRKELFTNAQAQGALELS